VMFSFTPVMWRTWYLTSQQVMDPACAVSFTDVAGSNSAACPRVFGAGLETAGWQFRVGRGMVPGRCGVGGSVELDSATPQDQSHRSCGVVGFSTSAGGPHIVLLFEVSPSCQGWLSFGSWVT